MANTKSAAKRARQSPKRHARNKAVIGSVRTEVRQAREAIASGDKGAITTKLREAVSALAKAASKGVIHKRNAQRRMGRLAAAAHVASAKQA